MVKTIEVKLKGIHCEHDGGDGNDNLEIYGSLHAQVFHVPTGTVRASQEMFRVPSGYVTIHKGNTFPVNKIVRFDLHDGDWLHIGGHLKEDDDFGDDDLGNRWEKIYGPSINTTPRDYYVRFEETGQTVRADYRVKQI
ncbi:hypothetical protein PDN49_11930 [Bacillus cereus]|uniref:hypothetical protein n=1 Tax=Bacillus thuringiensis TaxID=1428 RepID=UPI000D56BEF2|nr:hypothetical protein [Bacillus thuringiensis]MBD8076494.1 hypothetical protein [Bacillus thuringiensis]MDA2355525.1 hypothetical protein [Bacillus cereus]